MSLVSLLPTARNVSLSTLPTTLLRVILSQSLSLYSAPAHLRPPLLPCVIAFRPIGLRVERAHDLALAAAPNLWR